MNMKSSYSEYWTKTVTEADLLLKASRKSRSIRLLLEIVLSYKSDFNTESIFVILCKDYVLRMYVYKNNTPPLLQY